MRTLLAPDPVLPQRDLLLDPEQITPLLEERLSLYGPVELASCEIARVKYRVGQSLRVRYTVEVDGRSHDVACHAFARGHAEAAFRRALGEAVATDGLRAVAWARELETVFWTFPNDRKLRLGALAALDHLLGPRLHSLELVAYAPEKSATLRCDGEAGQLAYAKLYADDGADRAFALHRHLAGAGMPVPQAIPTDQSLRLLLVRPLAGRPLAQLEGAELIEGHERLGETIARLHELPPPDRVRARRLDTDRLRAAAEIIACARPDVADAARRVGAEIARRGTPQPLVCLHGDLHPKNALLHGGRVGLVDLDQVAGGSASAELGSLFAGLRCARVVGRLDGAKERECAAAFAAGYATVRPLPPAPVLRRATAAALLGERALRAVNRVRPDGLSALGRLFAAAQELLDA